MIYAAFARMRGDRQRIAEVWLNGLMLVGGIVLPVLVLLIALAPDLIPLTFGRQWIAAVPVVQIWPCSSCRERPRCGTPRLSIRRKTYVGMILNALILIALLRLASAWE